MFTVLALLALVIVLLLPKRFEASTLIVIDENEIIKPLVEARGSKSSVSDETAIISQIVTGRKVLRELLVFGGWVKPPPARQPDAREEESLLKQLRARIKIENTHDEMVRITFSDSDPKRTYQVANKLAEIYLRESQEGKTRETREAFEFIDKQAKEYGDKLADIHQKVLAQYRGDTVATPAPASNDKRAAPARPKLSADQLADLRAEAALLETQIARSKAPATPPKIDTRTQEQLRSRVSQLETELDKLRTTFTDEHPDVKRVRRELAGAKSELEQAERGVAEREAAARAAALATAQADDDVARAARARLDDVRRRIAAATGQPPPRRGAPVERAQSPDAIDPEMRSVGRDTALSELLRNYEATRDIYQDLLKRRDNARLAMELETQNRTFTMRVQEPAEMPATASSLRMMHMTMIAMVFALGLPLAFLVGIVRLDRRVRSPQQIARLVPLLASISDSPTRRDKSRYARREVYAALMVAGVLVIYVAVFVMKLRAPG
jgi:polysaccharide chain length determinant protein (PEP-CTERM system associated)